MCRVAGLFLAIFTAVCGSVTLALAQAATPTTHLEVIVTPARATAQQTPAAPSLNRSDFRLSQQGQKLSFHLVSNPNDPQHLLVVTDAPLACAALPTELIEKMFGRHWQVRIADTGGTATAELTSDHDLQSACDKLQHLSTTAVIHDLARQAGRRVVLFTGAATPSLIAEAGSVPEIYTVDGGVQVTSETPLLRVPQPTPVSPSETAAVSGYVLPCHETGGKVAPNDPCNIVLSNTYRKSGFRAGVNHEKSLKSALRAIEQAGNRYYDLTFQPASAAPVQLALHYPARIHVTVAMYSVAPPAPLTAASPNPQPLRVPRTSDLRITQW